jgi:hypothetical protein
LIPKPVAAERDTIGPLDAARALNDLAGAREKELLIVPGGNVGAVVGEQAQEGLYPMLTEWFRRTPCNSVS